MTESPETHDMFGPSWFPASGLSDDGRVVAVRAVPLPLARWATMLLGLRLRACQQYVRIMMRQSWVEARGKRSIQNSLDSIQEVSELDA